MKRVFYILVCILIIVSALVSCKNDDLKSKTFYTYFDTVITVVSYEKETQKQFESNCVQIEKLLDKYNRLFDIYHEYSGLNNLCTINKNPEKEISVDPAIIELLQDAKKYYELTNGKVNVMLGPVLQQWHSTISETSVLPDQNKLKEAFQYCTFNQISIDEKSSTVKLMSAKAAVDVGAIAKGFATEKIASYLYEKGLTSYAINAGGNVRLVGEKFKGTDWTVAIRNPQGNESDFSLILKLHDTSCVTSGVYERHININGKEYHHIIDKDTLMPANFFDSVSVIYPDSGLADVLSTALFCMSYQDGLNLIESIDGAEVIWIYHDGSIRYTDGVNQLIYEN